MLHCSPIQKDNIDYFLYRNFFSISKLLPTNNNCKVDYVLRDIDYWNDIYKDLKLVLVWFVFLNIFLSDIVLPIVNMYSYDKIIGENNHYLCWVLYSAYQEENMCGAAGDVHRSETIHCGLWGERENHKWKTAEAENTALLSIWGFSPEWYRHMMLLFLIFFTLPLLIRLVNVPITNFVTISRDLSLNLITIEILILIFSYNKCLHHSYLYLWVEIFIKNFLKISFLCSLFATNELIRSKWS